jgi:hypothetical protein
MLASTAKVADAVDVRFPILAIKLTVLYFNGFIELDAVEVDAVTVRV